MTKLRHRRAARADSGIARAVAEETEMGHTIKPLLAAATACVTSMNECQVELGRFVSNRLASDVKLGQGLLGCRTLEQATELQQDWTRQVIDDYMAEGQKLWQIGMGWAAHGIQERH